VAYQKLTPHVLRILNNAIIGGLDEDLGHAINMLSRILARLEKVDDTLLVYFPIICYIWLDRPDPSALKMNISSMPEEIQTILTTDIAVFGYPINEYTQIIGCFLNYIQKCGTTFLDANDFFGTPFVTLIMNIVKNIGEACMQPSKTQYATRRTPNVYRNSFDDTPLVFILKVIIGLVENNRGRLDAWMPQIIAMVVELCTLPTRTGYFKKFLNQVIGVFFWYDPQKVLQYIASSCGGKTDANGHPMTGEQVMKKIVNDFRNSIPDWTKDYEKGRMLWGMCGLVGLSRGELNELFNFQEFMGRLGQLSKEIIEYRESDNTTAEEDRCEVMGGGGDWAGTDGGVFSWFQAEKIKAGAKNAKEQARKMDCLRQGM
jgi:hypothetical protein